MVEVGDGKSIEVRVIAIWRPPVSRIRGAQRMSCAYAPIAAPENTGARQSGAWKRCLVK